LPLASRRRSRGFGQRRRRRSDRTVPVDCAHDLHACLRRRPPGIIDGDFQRAYLVAAWRAIGGKPLDDPEVRQLALALRDGTQPDYESSGAKVWADARTKFGPKAGANAAEVYIGPSRDASAKSGAQLLDLEYDNCVDAGSRTAAATLTARAKAYGNADSNPWVAEWIHGQDAVFSNCSSGSGMPSPA
jgi:hypothetical protein